MNNVFIHLKPTAEELRSAFLEMSAADTLQFLPEWLRDVKGWMEYLHPKAGQPRAISFCPVVIEVDGRYPAVIWLTNYCPANRFAVIHFAGHAQFRPKTVFKVAKLAVDMLLGSSEIDTLLAFFEDGDVRAVRMSQAMRFSVLMKVGVRVRI